MRSRHLFMLSLSLTVSLALVGCSEKSDSAKVNSTTKKGQTEKKNTPPKPVVTTIQIAAIGDILIHTPISKAFHKGNSYNFNPIFAKIAPMLRQPDFLIANQESVPGGKKLGLSTFPLLNCPQEIVDNLITNGVDMFAQANNHVLDKGYKGIQSATSYYKLKKTPYVGVYADATDQNTPRIIDVKGIKVGVVAYTFGTNGIPIPKDKPFVTNLIDQTKMKQDIERIKSESDVVVAVMHWGNEYQRQPSTYQKNIAQFLCDNGVSIIFGSHPHVLQPIEWLESSITGKSTICIYSLGNFISNQKDKYTDIGGMMQVGITKTVDDKKSTIAFEQIEFFPTYVKKRWNYPRYQILPIDQAPAAGLKYTKPSDIKNFMMKNLTNSTPVSK